MRADCTVQTVLYSTGQVDTSRPGVGGWPLAVGRWPFQVGGDASHHSTEGSSRHRMRVLNSKIIPKRKEISRGCTWAPLQRDSVPRFPYCTSKYVFAFGSAAAHHGVAP